LYMMNIVPRQFITQYNEHIIDVILKGNEVQKGHPRSLFLRKKIPIKATKMIKEI
jgi:hypothetical protein